MLLSTFGLVVGQEKVADHLMDPGATVHLFTDDPAYRLHYFQKHQENVADGTLMFGPQTTDMGSTESGVGADDWNLEKFKRETDVRTSVLDFMTMALCDHHYATKGSTVHDLVRLLNRRYGEHFLTNTVIGSYHTNTDVTNRFRHHMESFVKSSYEHLWDRSDNNITMEQANILEFLNEFHMKQMYDSIVKILGDHGGSLPGARLGALFQENCRVAKLNREKFIAQPSKPGGQHWLKALLLGRMAHFTCINHLTTHHILINDSNEISLKKKTPVFAMGVGGSASSSQSSGPSSKRPRHN